MTRKPGETRERILAAAYELFYRKGFHRTTLDEIAARAGVQKRTLYYHVRSKDELAGAMLEHRHVFVLKQIARWGTSTDPREFVGEVFASIAHWAENTAAKERRPRRHWLGSGITRMAVELADLPGHPARSAARRHKAAVESELARRLSFLGVADPRRAAAQVQILMEGVMIMILVHGDTRYAHWAAEAARAIVAQSLRD